MFLGGIEKEHSPEMDYIAVISSQLTFTCSKSTIETLEKGLKYVQS